MNADQEYAKALASSMVADMARAPTLERVVHSREISEGQFFSIIKRDLERDFKGQPGPPLFPNLRALMRTEIQVQQRLPIGLGQDWGAIVSAIVPALAGAASKYYVARTESRTATSITKLQLQSQALQMKSLDTQAAVDRASAANAEGVPGADASMPGGTLSPRAAAESGIPGWVAPVGGVAAALGVSYIIYKVIAG